MGNYLSWVAGKIQERQWVQYSSTVTRIVPAKNGSSSQVTSWKLNVEDAQGNNSTIASKRVVLATGSKPKIHEALMGAKGKVLHSSEVAPLLHSLKDQDIAIVGADQEAAEIFEHLQSAGGFAPRKGNNVYRGLCIATRRQHFLVSFTPPLLSQTQGY